MILLDYLPIIILFILVISVCLVIIKLKEQELKFTNERYENLIKQWKEHVDNTNRTKQSLWDEIESTKEENEKLKAIIEKHEKEKNVSRETSYNQSFGMPEVIDYFDQQYAREETKRG